MTIGDKLDELVQTNEALTPAQSLSRVSSKSVQELKKISDRLHRAGKSIEMEHAKVAKLSRILLSLPGDISVGTIMQDGLEEIGKTLSRLNTAVMTNNTKELKKSKDKLSELTTTLSMYLSDMGRFVRDLENRFQITRNDIYNTLDVLNRDTKR